MIKLLLETKDLFIKRTDRMLIVNPVLPFSIIYIILTTAGAVRQADIASALIFV